MHEKQLQSDSPCIRRPNDLQVQNDEPNRKGITEARAQKVTEAINQYMNDGTLPSGRQHGKWVDDNYERYIGQSSTTEVVARLELGKWLVAWYTIFPSVTIPSNPCWCPLFAFTTFLLTIISYDKYYASGASWSNSQRAYQTVIDEPPPSFKRRTLQYHRRDLPGVYRQMATSKVRSSTVTKGEAPTGEASNGKASNSEASDNEAPNG